jgi:hypothetical protein
LTAEPADEVRGYRVFEIVGVITQIVGDEIVHSGVLTTRTACVARDSPLGDDAE